MTHHTPSGIFDLLWGRITNARARWDAVRFRIGDSTLQIGPVFRRDWGTASLSDLRNKRILRHFPIEREPFGYTVTKRSSFPLSCCHGFLHQLWVSRAVCRRKFRYLILDASTSAPILHPTACLDAARPIARQHFGRSFKAKGWQRWLALLAARGAVAEPSIRRDDGR